MSITDATVYVGGLDEKVSEAILWELFLQAGPVGECAGILFLFLVFCLFVCVSNKKQIKTTYFYYCYIHFHLNLA